MVLVFQLASVCLAERDEKKGRKAISRHQTGKGSAPAAAPAAANNRQRNGSQASEFICGEAIGDYNKDGTGGCGRHCKCKWKGRSVICEEEAGEYIFDFMDSFNLDCTRANKGKCVCCRENRPVNNITLCGE
mmetsp:Transcript_6826/g.13235  ORF Transcript_6826/g.13235 Transcript_6826/m.13235 type:complete len:132 (+) Transcript_6826:3-398(+)